MQPEALPVPFALPVNGAVMALVRVYPADGVTGSYSFTLFDEEGQQIGESDCGLVAPIAATEENAPGDIADFLTNPPAKETAPEMTPADFVARARELLEAKVSGVELEAAKL